MASHPVQMLYLCLEAMMNLITDTALIEGIQQDEEHAFRILFDRYWESMLAMAIKRTRCQSTSEDIVQEVFADIWKRRATLSIQSNLKSYLLTAVKYHIYKAIQKKQEEMSIEDNSSLLNIAETPNELEFQELYHKLEIAIDKLPENQQLIFRMSRFDGLKSSEIASKLSVSPQTVHNNLHRSLKVLRTELKDYAPLVVAYLFLN